METALKLSVPEGHGEEQDIRCYSLEDVKELQNKLMLMSGKAEHNNEVEHFTEVNKKKQKKNSNNIKVKLNTNKRPRGSIHLQ